MNCKQFVQICGGDINLFQNFLITFGTSIMIFHQAVQFNVPTKQIIIKHIKSSLKKSQRINKRLRKGNIKAQGNFTINW